MPRFVVSSLCAPATAVLMLLGTSAPVFAAEPAKRILVLPPVQWPADPGAAPQPALHQTPSDLARLMGGLVFGMSAQDVNDALPNPVRGLTWNDLPAAAEYSQEVRYFWMPLQGAGPLLAGIQGCAGAPSYIVFLFRTSGLYRVSFRFLPDQACPDVSRAASDLFARFTPLSTQVAFSVHYRTGRADVVDITDPGAGLLMRSQRWRARAQ